MLKNTAINLNHY